MDLVDERGRLFGLVNVIDALVVLLVVAVVVAGVALVLQEPQPEQEQEQPSPDTETRYATISFGNQPAAIAETIATGDSTRFANGGTAIVTDVYRAPRPNGDVFVVARVSTTGRVEGGSFAVGGNPFRVGNAVNVTSNTFALKGHVTALGRSDDQLPTSETSVVVEATVPTAVASNIHEDDAYRVGTTTGATVASVDVSPTANPDRRRLLVGVRLRTLSTEGGPQFAGQPVRVGQNLALAPDDATLQGTIVARGTTTPPGERTDATVRIAWHDVRPVVANEVSVGTTEQLRGATVTAPTARVVDRHVTPETVVVRADNGTLHEREHPRRLNVTLTVDLVARRTDDGLRFHGRRIQVSRTVVFDFGTITVRGQVVEIDSEP